VALLRYYIVYRALVRAKVEALRVEPSARQAATSFKAAFAYLRLAEQWASSRDAGMILMHGLSGSGKSTVAAQLVEALGAIQLRSDVVRKQLFELAPDADSGSATDQGIYSKDATELTYHRLRDIAAQVLAADFRVIVDATFLLETQRQVLLELAVAAACPCVVVDCEAPLAELRRRIIERENDPSEASLQVLERQIQKRQPVRAAEAGITGIVTLGAEGLGDAQVDQIRRLLISSPSTGRR
jgi:predicted kinase